MDYLSLDKTYTFPAQNVPPEEKEKPEYGVQYARGIYTSIITNQLNTTRRITIQQNRSYAMGLQDEKQYIDWIGARIDNEEKKVNNVGDTSYLNIDWSIVSPAPKVIDGIINRIVNPDYKIELNAIDAVSYTKKQAEKDKLYGKIVMDKALAPIEEETKLQLVNRSGNEPKNEEEIEMFMDMGFKLPIEAGLEELCEWESYVNKFNEEIRPRVVRDIVENNKGVIRIYFDNNMRPKVRYVDIEHFYTTYTDDPYYKDIDYGAELRLYTIREIRELSQLLTEEQLFKIAQEAANRYGNPKWQLDTAYNPNTTYNNQWSYDDFRVLCLDFLCYTIDKRTYSEYKDKYGTDRFVRVKSDFKPKKSNTEYKLQKETNECEYEGLWVVGTDHMVRYGRAKNIIYPVIGGKRSNVPMRKFIAVEPGLRYGMSRSIVSKIRPNLNNIQGHVLRMRHFVAEAVPPGIAIDVNRIMDVVATMKMTGPMDLVTLYKQKGIAVYSGVDQNGDPVNGKSVDFLQNGIGDGLLPYINAIKFEMDQIREITGFNDAMDAISPDPKALPGIQKLALISAHSNLKHLYTAFYYGIFGRYGETMCRAIQMFIEFGEGKEVYEPVIGKAGIDFLGFLDGCFYAELGIKTEEMPTGEKLQEVYMTIEKEVANGALGSEDAWMAKNILNPKKAMMYIAFAKRKRAEQMMKQKAEEEALIGQREKETAMAAAEADAIKQQAEGQVKIAVLQEEYRLKKELDMVMTENKKALEEKKTEGKLKEIEQAFKFKDTSAPESDDVVPGVDDPELFADPADAATRID
jgi:hypothetical protein